MNDFDLALLRQNKWINQSNVAKSRINCSSARHEGPLKRMQTRPICLRRIKPRHRRQGQTNGDATSCFKCLSNNAMIIKAQIQKMQRFCFTMSSARHGDYININLYIHTRFKF